MPVLHVGAAVLRGLPLAAGVDDAVLHDADEVGDAAVIGPGRRGAGRRPVR
ncbi:MAG TPA: hypothetical protein VGP02_13025 [Mycobacteriales bacterium]|nr:hypothetical protein [Mycobacteriales bacterium]